MGRIRSMKPDLLAEQRFASLSDGAVRLFFGLVSLADDRGNCPAAPRYLRGQIFWARQRSPIAICHLLRELSSAGLIDLYEIDGEKFAAVVGWLEKDTPTYQRIDKPQPPKFPLPNSVRSWNAFCEGSQNVRVRIRREEIGPEQKGSEHSPAAPVHCANLEHSTSELIESYDAQHLDALGTPSHWRRSDRDRLHELVEQFGECEVAKRIDRMFTDGPHWFRDRSPRTFVEQFDALLELPAS